LLLYKCNVYISTHSRLTTTLESDDDIKSSTEAVVVLCSLPQQYSSTG